MASEEAFVAILASVKDATDVSRLREVHTAINANLLLGSTHRASLSSLVLCAETAIKVMLQSNSQIKAQGRVLIPNQEWLYMAGACQARLAWSSVHR